jgi:hypothetical protein
MGIHPGYLADPAERQQRSPDLGLVLLERRPSVSPKLQADQVAHVLPSKSMTGGCADQSFTVTLRNSGGRNV